MAGAQVVEKFLAEILQAIDVQDEEIGMTIHDHALGFFDTASNVDVDAGRGFAQSGVDRSRQAFVRCEHQDTAGWHERLGLICRRSLIQNGRTFDEAASRLTLRFI
jgi:hypothetical protein